MKCGFRLKLAKKLCLIFCCSCFWYLTSIYLVAYFSKPKLIGAGCLPDYLKTKKHNDYTFLFRPLRFLPFAATSFCFEEPPIMILGNQKSFEFSRNKSLKGPKPVPKAGEYQLSVIQVKKNLPLFLPYFAITFKNNLHFRIGCRWDDVDHYYVFPSIALH